MNRIFICFQLIIGAICSTSLISCEKDNSNPETLSSVSAIPLPGDQIISVFKQTGENEFMVGGFTGNKCQVFIVDNLFRTRYDWSDYFVSGSKIKDGIKAKNGDYYMTVEHPGRCAIWRFGSDGRFVDSVTMVFPYITTADLFTYVGSIFDYNGQLTVIGIPNDPNGTENLRSATTYYTDYNFANFKTGNRFWMTKSYGFSFATKGVINDDGSIHISGPLNSLTSTINSRMSFIYINAEGEQEIVNRFGTEYNKEISHDIVHFGSNKLVLSSSTAAAQQGINDIRLIELNHNCDTVRTKIIPLPDEDIPHAIIQTSDLGFLITGVTKSIEPGKFVTFVMKINNNLDMEWIKPIGSEAEGGIAIIQPAGNNRYAVAFSTKAFNKGINQLDFCFVSIDESGNLIQ